MEVPSITKCLVGISLVCLAVLPACSGDCTYPGLPQNHTTVGTNLADYPNGFTTDQAVVFACDVADGRFGVIVQYCKSDGGWTEPDRVCLDALGIDSGSIGGICMAAFNIAIAVFSIVFSRQYRKKNSTDEEESG